MAGESKNKSCDDLLKVGYGWQTRTAFALIFEHSTMKYEYSKASNSHLVLHFTHIQ